MKQGFKYGSPAFFALLVLLIVEVINIAGLLPLQQRNDFEIISNIAMFTVALVGFFCLGLPSQKTDCTDVGIFLVNIVVSGIAFLMNIYVFEHVIQLERLLESLWCCHMLWIICIVVQFLFLTGLGKWLWHLIQKLLSWGKNISNCVENSYSCLVDIVKRSNKSMVLTIFIGFILWSIILINRIRNQGANFVFSDTGFWRSSIWMWAAIITISYLLHMVPLIFKKNKEAIISINSKKVFAATVFLFLAAAANVLPSLLQTIMIIISLPVAAMGILLLVIKNIYEKTRDGKREGLHVEDRTLKDVSIVLFCFVGLPLTIIFLVTFLMGNNSEIITQDPTNITAWLEFVRAAAETADYLLNLFN